MKKLVYIILIALITISCSVNKNNSVQADKLHSSKPDSLEHEILILDPDFERWYLMRYSTSLDRSNEFYRTKNYAAVTNWNTYLMRNKYRRVVNSHINYNPSIDYGIEVNRKLYWYFRYVEERFRVPLLR